jgi:hypothetical protein
MNHYQHESRTRQGELSDLPDAARVAETRRLLERLGGPVYDAAELAREYRVVETMGAWTFVQRLSDGAYGSLIHHEGADLWYKWVPNGH